MRNKLYKIFVGLLVLSGIAVGAGSVRETGTSIVLFTQVESTPSNPSTGQFRAYFKSDGNLYKLNSSGVEAQIAGTGTSQLEVDEKVTDYSILTSDDFIIANGSNGGGFTLSLPTAVGNTGKVFYVKNITDGSSVIYLQTISNQTIDGSSSVTLDIKNKALSVTSDGSNWKKIQDVVPNTVTTPQAAGKILYTAHIDGTSGTPVVSRQDGSWISSITDSGVGDYTLQITAGIFTTKPTCTCASSNGGFGGTCSINGDTGTSSFNLRVGNNDAAADERAMIFCTTN